MAVVLTYLAVAANYTPDVYNAIVKKYEAHHSVIAVATPGSGAVEPVANEPPAALKIVYVVLSFIGALLIPFLSLPPNIIGVLIIAIALWEAWKINVGGFSSVAGPFSLKTARMPI